MSEATVDGYPRQLWWNADGETVVESYTITNMAHGTPLVGTAAVDGALDLEQGVQTPDRLQRDRGDRFAFLSVPGGFLDIGQLEEAPPRMG